MKKYKILNIVNTIIVIIDIALMVYSLFIKADAQRLIDSSEAGEQVGGTFVIILAVSFLCITACVAAGGLVLSLIGTRADTKNMKIWSIVLAVLFAAILITMLCSILFY